MWQRHNHRKGWLFLFIPLGIAAMSLIVMLLWNALLPDIFHLREITYWEAAGLFILSKLLLGGGFSGRHHHNHRHDHNEWKQEWKQQWKNKWEHMTPEERDRFKMKLRYKGGFGNWEFEAGPHNPREQQNPPNWPPPPPPEGQAPPQP